MPTIPGPMLVLWGDKDVFTPPDGPVGKYLQNLPSVRPNTTFQFLTGGHTFAAVETDTPPGPKMLRVILMPEYTTATLGCGMLEYGVSRLASDSGRLDAICDLSWCMQHAALIVTALMCCTNAHSK